MLRNLQTVVLLELLGRWLSRPTAFECLNLALLIMLKERKAFEKKEKDRKRNIVVLVLKFLLDNGWIDSFTKLEQESTLSYNQW